MMTDLRVGLPNRPGSLVQALEAVAAEGVTIAGFCGDIRPGEKWAYMHMLTEDHAAARRALELAGFDIISEHEVDVFELEDDPRALLDAALRYREQGRNIEVVYMATRSQLVVGTEDMQKERYGVRMGDARY